MLAEIERLAAENNGVPPTLQDRATRLVIQISAVTHALRPLVRDGLIVLHSNETDGRVKGAALTRSGAARVRQAFLHWTEAAALRALADHVAPDEFLAAYESVRANEVASPE